MKLWTVRYAIARSGGPALVKEEDFYLPTAEDVRRSLRMKGFWPIRIKERKPPMFEWMDVRSTDWQRQLLRALRFQSATSSTGSALLSIIEGETDPRRRLAFLPTRAVLKGGGSFSESIQKLRLFDAATMAIIIAGERASDLKGVIAHAIEHVEEKGKQFKMLVAALGWLSFDIISIVSTIFSAQYGFIPYLKAQPRSKTDPEASMKFDQAINTVSIINISLIVITMGGLALLCFMGMVFWQNRDKPDHYASRFIAKVPLISTYLRDSNMHDSCKLMARLLRGNVPLDEALKIIISTSIEPNVRRYWLECQDRIMTGVDTSKALARAPLTRPEIDQVRSIQSIDQLAEVFEGISEERQGQAKTGQRKIMMAGLGMMMLLFGAVVLTMIYLLSIQNQGFMDSLKDMRG